MESFKICEMNSLSATCRFKEPMGNQPYKEFGMSRCTKPAGTDTCPLECSIALIKIKNNGKIEWLKIYGE